MSNLEPLPRSFFDRPTVRVARQLLGQRLVRIEEGGITAGIITEVEAYVGETDLACHARAGRTRRNAVMYGPPGHLYVYFTYGMHWMLNVVTEHEGFPAAVLLRAVWPDEGLDRMQARRGRADHLADGPARLAQAFGLKGQVNGMDLCSRSANLCVVAGERIQASKILSRPRIGIGRTPEPWLSVAWNFSYLPKQSR